MQLMPRTKLVTVENHDPTTNNYGTGLTFISASKLCNNNSSILITLESEATEIYQTIQFVNKTLYVSKLSPEDITSALMLVFNTYDLSTFVFSWRELPQDMLKDNSLIKDLELDISSWRFRVAAIPKDIAEKAGLL